MSLALCFCWKKKRSNPELSGVDGIVIRKNPDENVNHLPNVDVAITDDASKKIAVGSNSRRSLPDIPAQQENASWSITADNSSEHYATLEQYHNSIKRHTIPNGLEGRPSVSQHSSLSQADFSPYERVKYDKIKSDGEHPYAKLQPAPGRLPNGNIPEESVPGSSQQRSNDDIDSGRSVADANPQGDDIPAAAAVAGSIAARPELPYMTPPVAQINFSGDSQDSSKGYTSISVREPLADIRAVTKEVIEKRRLDPHYSTVSDDSDDVYTTIPDPNREIYTSESETYARITPGSIVVEAEINHCPSSSNTDSACGEDVQQPPPPSVNSLKHVAHSRQASSSSSIAYVGSPKPEKRQANSPLPLPPSTNIDDLYAKVQKPKTTSQRSCSDEERERPEIISIQQVDPEPEHDYEKLREPINDYEKIGRQEDEEPGYASINGPDENDPAYEILMDKKEAVLPPSAGDSYGYSVVNKKKKINRKKKRKEEDSFDDSQDYESMQSESISEFQYAGFNSDDTDPNYESVNEPPYERVDSRGYENIDTSTESSDGATNLSRGRRKVENQYEKLSNSECDTDSKVKRLGGANSTSCSGSSTRSDSIDNPLDV